MDEKELRETEAEARRAVASRTTRGRHPIERYLAAFLYGGRRSGTTRKDAPVPDRDATEPGR